MSTTTQTQTEPAEYKRTKTGRLIPCPGEAHRNAYIDSCGHCAPRWGEVEEMAPVDLDFALAAGLDVAACDLTAEQNAAMMAAVERGEARLVSVTRKKRWGSTSYYVFRWVAPTPRRDAAELAQRAL